MLYERVYGRQLTTPLAVMTSLAKGNHRRVRELCESMAWFGRGRRAFRLFKQPMVPVVTVHGEGKWVRGAEPLTLDMKPGGHGVIWKLASDTGVLRWLSQEHGRRAAVVRAPLSFPPLLIFILHLVRGFLLIHLFAFDDDDFPFLFLALPSLGASS